MDVFITDTAAFLPNDAVDNDAMEDVLGRVHGVPSRTRRIILRNNGIRTRHYAIDPLTGLPTHTNAQLAAEAVRRLAPWEGFGPGDVGCLCCGTSSADQMMPGHASMVHGELGGVACETVSTAGVCVSGVTALKYAAMSVGMGLSPHAVAAGSELASSLVRAQLHENRGGEKAEALEKDGGLVFDADFLRWMLSDGAGAVFLERSARAGRRCFRIDWIDILSYAHDLDACMYAGAEKRADGSLRGWREFGSARAAAEAGAFAIRQDVKLLNREIMPVSVRRALRAVVDRRGIRAGEIDWLLPHYSSDYFRRPLHDLMVEIGFDVPFERWYTNLAERGNTGAASIYIMLDEFRRTCDPAPGQRILCYVPESGRFAVAWMLLTVV